MTKPTSTRTNAGGIAACNRNGLDNMISRQFITTLIFDYVCSVCWSNLKQDGENGPVICANDAEHQGFVTCWYAYTKREQSGYSLIEVKQNYMDSEWGVLLGLAAPQTNGNLQEKLQANKRKLGRDPGDLF